jgi:hypothetical protein
MNQLNVQGNGKDGHNLEMKGPNISKKNIFSAMKSE